MNNQQTTKDAQNKASTADNCYVVIRDMSAGNDSVGEMWQETKIFKGNDTIDNVMRWALNEECNPIDLPISYSRKRVTITRPHSS